jgi:hypothetical protein
MLARPSAVGHERSVYVEGDRAVRVLKVKRYGIILAVMCLIALALSSLWKVPYLYTALGFAVWAFGGHLVTIDDDLAGGWSNPDGSISFLWGELTIKAAILLVLIGLAFLIPGLRSLGA